MINPLPQYQYNNFLPKINHINFGRSIDDAVINPQNYDCYKRIENPILFSDFKIEPCKSKEDYDAYKKLVIKSFELDPFSRLVRNLSLAKNIYFENNTISFYLVKNKENKLTGAFALIEKYDYLKNNCKELYIAEMCIDKNTKNTKTSYYTLKKIEELITEKSKNFDILTLRVDPEKKELINMYKKMGFEITNKDLDYYEMQQIINPKIKKLPTRHNIDFITDFYNETDMYL